MTAFRNQLKETLKKVQAPSKTQISFLYKAMMPDYRQNKHSALRDSKGTQPIFEKSGNTKSVRRMKGQAGAQDVINEIYEMKLFQLLNESSKGATGGRGRRAAERREIEK